MVSTVLAKWTNYFTFYYKSDVIFVVVVLKTNVFIEHFKSFVLYWFADHMLNEFTLSIFFKGTLTHLQTNTLESY